MYPVSFVPLSNGVDAYAKAMPGSLDVALHPFLDGLNVLVAILQLLSLRLLVARHGSLSIRLLVWLRHRDGPAAVLDTRGEVPGEGILVGVVQVKIIRACFRVEVKDGMHVLHLTGVCVHAPSRLTRLDVTPHHGHHVSLIVHESRIEVRHGVRVGRRDVRRATRERVF